jgi:hypothetical protein
MVLESEKGTGTDGVIKQNNLRGLSPHANYADRQMVL